MGGRALLTLLLWVPLFLGGGTWGDGVEDQKDDGIRGGTATTRPGDDLLSRLGRAAWVATENWLGPQPLRLVAESLSATLWVVASGISVALTTLCGILGDLLATTGHSGELLEMGGGGGGRGHTRHTRFVTHLPSPSPGDRLVRAVALSPAEVQGVLLWALVALVASWLLSRLLGLLLPLLRWLKLFCFLAAFLHVATCRESPTTQAGLLLGLWLLYALLGGWLVAPPATSPQLEASLRSLEWKVEELRRRQRWGGPRNREE
uniref:Transmembrane protein 109 n=1 Tax=Calidris pygmaea TaxID=425635 RepID=A0A8C3KCM1_9CHAR